MRAVFLTLLVAGIAAGCGDGSAGNESNTAKARTTVAGDAETTAAPAKAVASASDDAKAYNACAACHLPDGVGIPGAFPPLRNRISAIAGLNGGREYLITVVSYGLMGTMQAGGQNYSGVMPGHNGTMNSRAMAAALNHLVFGLTDDPSAVSSLSRFSEAEVDAVRKGVTAPSPMTASALRAELVKQHGDEWPR